MERLGQSRGWASSIAGLGQYVAYASAVLVGMLLSWLSADHPAALPGWMPWDFSAPEYSATALTLVWFVRGLALTPDGARLSLWRRACFLLGLLATYAVLQTHFEYWAQHMFFINRLQHVVMHHVGPFLMAFAGAGDTLRRGMPSWLRRMIEGRVVRLLLHIVQQPPQRRDQSLESDSFWWAQLRWREDIRHLVLGAVASTRRGLRCSRGPPELPSHHNLIVIAPSQNRLVSINRDPPYWRSALRKLHYFQQRPVCHRMMQMPG